VMDIVNSGSGGNVSEPYELGTFRGAISGPTTVNVNVSYNPSNPKQMSCDHGMSQGLNLEVPIEMMVGNIGSDLSGVDRVFEKTRTRLDTSDYDGAVSYFFEVIASNTFASPIGVQLVDSANNPVPGGTISVPASTTPDTRFRVQFTPSAGYNKYAVKIYGAGGVVNYLKLNQARILVKQVNASKTNLYFPLLTDTYNATSDYAGTTSVYYNTLGSYQNNAKFIAFKKANSNFSQIATGSPWILETVMSSTTLSSCAQLYQNTTVNVVGGGSPIQTCVSSTTPTQAETVFTDTEANFTDNTDFELKTKNLGSGADIYRAGLWLRLENISYGEAHYLVSRHVLLAPSTPHDNTYQRTFIDTSAFTNPSFYHDVAASGTTAATSFTGYFNTLGANDTDAAGSQVSGSGVLTTMTLANTKYRYRSSAAFSITSGDRLKSTTDTTGLSKDIAGMFFVVRFQR